MDPACYKHGMWVTLQHDPNGKFKSAFFRVKLPESLRQAASIARFGTGSVSVLPMKESADEH